MDEQPKFLAVKNWAVYNPATRMRDQFARLRYVLDWTSRFDDYDYNLLTMFQRGVLEGIIRACGVQRSRMVRNDAVWVASALHVVREERHCVRQALDKLIARGFLIPTNDEDFQVRLVQKSGGTGEGAGTRTGNGTGTEDVFQVKEGDQETPNSNGNGFDIPEEDA